MLLVVSWDKVSAYTDCCTKVADTHFKDKDKEKRQPPLFQSLAPHHPYGTLSYQKLFQTG